MVVVCDQDDLLECLESELTELVAARAPSGELVAALETTLGCRLWVVDSDDAFELQAVRHPIAPGTEVLGVLQSDIPVTCATSELARCLEYGARVVGIELVRERVALETRWSLEADLLTELLEVSGSIPTRLEQRARHAGFDLARRWHLLLLDVDAQPMPSELIAAARRPAMAGERSMCCLVADRLVVAVCDDADVRDAKLRDLQRIARGLGRTLRIGVSSAVQDFACGLRQAEAALRVAVCSPRTGVMHHKDLGTLRFLLDAPNQVELVSLVRAQIGPIAAHDRERHTELLDTLRIYLEEGGNRRRSAERCHVHQSTIKYRLRRIRDLLDCDLANADVRFDLMLALKVLELLRIVGADPTSAAGRQPAVAR